MDLQLYRVDSSNYLVDFRNVGYYRTDPSKPGFARAPHPPSPSTSPTASTTPSGTTDPLSTSPPTPPPAGLAESHHPKTGNGTNGAGASGEAGGIQEVCSPFLFLDCACRLIVELAGG